MECEKQKKMKKKKKKWTAKILGKRLLLWLVWYVLSLVLSTFALLYQVAKSIPGSLEAGRIWSSALKACVGATQGLVGNVILPYLAGRIMWQKHVSTTVSNLLTNCVIPVVVIIFLDTGLLGKANLPSSRKVWHTADIRDGAEFSKRLVIRPRTLYV